MNREFKVGDVVVLVDGRYLNTLEINLAKEKHLFEVEGVVNNIVNLKSVSANLEIEVYIEYVRHATLKEQYLRDGNSVVIDGIGYLVSGDILIGQKGGFTTDYFHDDLSKISNRGSITKVFYNPSGKFEDKIDENHELTIVLWKSKQKIELTSDEVIILKNVDERFKYIIRDSIFDSLFLFEEEPTINYISGTHLSAFDHLFKNITFESGAHLIADLIKGNKK